MEKKETRTGEEIYRELKACLAVIGITFGCLLLLGLADRYLTKKISREQSHDDTTNYIASC